MISWTKNLSIGDLSMLFYQKKQRFLDQIVSLMKLMNENCKWEDTLEMCWLTEIHPKPHLVRGYPGYARDVETDDDELGCQLLSNFRQTIIQIIPNSLGPTSLNIKCVSHLLKSQIIQYKVICPTHKSLKTGNPYGKRAWKTHVTTCST